MSTTTKLRPIIIKIFTIFFLLTTFYFIFFQPKEAFAGLCVGYCQKTCYDALGNPKECGHSVTATYACNGSCGDPELAPLCSGADETLTNTYNIQGASCPSTCSNYVWSYGCSNNKCTGNIVCADSGYTSWGNCLASCPADTSTVPPPVPPVGDPPCNWIVGSQFECECRPKDGNEMANFDPSQSCGGTNQYTPRGCSYQGDANHGCCCHQSPPPPPTRYRCTANSCTDGGQNGNYVGNSSCSGNCGIKCTIFRDDGTQASSGSENQNTGLCNNLTRAGPLNPNKASNPARYKVTCSSEEFFPANNVNRHWSISNIKYDSDDIYNNPGTGIITTQPAEIISFNPPPTVLPTSGTTTLKTMFMNFSVNYSIETTGTSASGITCDSRVNLDKLGDSVGGEFYDQYSYTCSKLNNPVDTEASQQNLLRDEIAKRLNGPLSGGVSVAPKWGNFSRVGNGPIVSNTATTSINNDSIVIIPDTLCAGVPCITDKFTDVLYFKVKHHSTYTPPAGVNCTDLYPLTTEITGTYYQLICVTGDTNITQANLADYTRQMLNGSGYKPNSALGMGVPVFDGTSQYNYTDPVASQASSPKVNPRLQGVYAKTEDPNLQKNTFTAYFDVKYKDGIPFGNKTLNVSITDGYTGNPSSKTVSIVQTIDTSVPTVTRTMQVQSMNKFNVTSTAVDDHLLKTHAYYIAPTKYMNVPASNPPDYPFVSQYVTQNNTSYFLALNQFKSISPVTPANDFPIRNFTRASQTESNYAFGDSGNYDANGNKVYFKKAVSGLTDIRTSQYELDLTTLVNQKTAYDLNFGNGKDGSNGGFGRWYVEDSFCNASSGNSQNLSVGSPWIQTKMGNVFVKGSAMSQFSDQKSVNMSIHEIANTCQLVNSSSNPRSALLTFCPEKSDGYLSTFLFQSSVANTTKTGPISESTTQRGTKNDLTSTNYMHGLTKLSSYFNGATGAYDYVNNIVNKVINDGDLTNPINRPCGPAGNLDKRFISIVGGNKTITQTGANGSYNILDNINGDNNDKPCRDGSGVDVISLSLNGGTLTLGKLPDPTGSSAGGIPNFPGLPVANCGGNAMMRLQPDASKPLGTAYSVNPGQTFKAVVAKNIPNPPYITTETNAIIQMQAPNGVITTVGSNGAWQPNPSPLTVPGIYVFVATLASQNCKSDEYAYLTINGALPPSISPSITPTAPDGSNNIIVGDNPQWPHWWVNNDTIILVNGNVTINPDIRKDLNNNAKSLIIVASGNIDILGGNYKSYLKTQPTEYPFYDGLDAFLIADGQIKTESDTPSAPIVPIVLDGLKIRGGLMQLGKNSSTFTPCNNPNQNVLRDGQFDFGSNPCFGRDLILMHNFVAPAEKIQFDPGVEEVFSSAIGEFNIIYSIREVKTKTVGTTP